MLKLILLIVGIVIGAILLFALTKPDTFRVERSIVINATPQTIVSFLDDFHRWGAWSPWEKKDPGMKRTFGGPEHGVGATYEWEGNGQVGRGRMSVTRVTADHVAINLDFLAPMEAHNDAEFALVPGAGGTRVTWSMHGPLPYLSKVMHVFTSMDALVGKDFEAGLSDLKRVAEAAQNSMNLAS